MKDAGTEGRCSWVFFTCGECPYQSEPFLAFSFYIYFVYLFLAAPQDMWDLSSLARGQARAPCIGSVESQPLDSQGSPSLCFLKNKIPSQFRTHGDVVSLVLRQPEKSLCY